MGLSIEDSKYIDLDTYLELVGIQNYCLQSIQKVNNNKPRRATQEDIDKFLG